MAENVPEKQSKAFQIKYGSKIKRLVVPLFNYRAFGDKDFATASNYIERRHLMSQLEKWLDCKDGNTKGAYLITGYRGMGKTSFVEKVLERLEDKASKGIPGWLSALVILVFVLIPWLLFFFMEDKWENKWLWVAPLIAFAADSVSLIIPIIRRGKQTQNPLQIKINVGNELKDERDILAIIANTVYDKFKDYVRHFSCKKGAVWQSLLCALAWSAILLFCFEYVGLSDSEWKVFEKFPCFEKLRNIGPSLLNFILAVVCVSVTVKVFCRFCYKHFFSYTDRFPHRALIRLARIVEHISYSTEESVKADSNMKSLSFSLVAQRGRKRPPLTLREMEYELSKIIAEITDNPYFHCRFIFIYDELDKIDFSRNMAKGHDDAGRYPQTVFPVLSSDELFSSDNITLREKQQRLISLLGQMKYFISTTKAKFVFIAGHELYDAYLADVSDREFSVSSIFNGIINLPSFLSTDSRYKSVTKMTEAFVCKALFYKDKKVEKQNGINNQADDFENFKLENISKQYLKYVKCDAYGADEFTEYLVTTLLHFITYLTFMSNGAPKKVVSQFDKYILSNDQYTKLLKENKIDENVLLLKPKDELTEKDGKYAYLSLGFKDLEKIGFIRYIAQPIFSNILDKDSDYDDRLLVTSLFLISHIYKHSHSGFSWRDLEYIPELTENSHSPELRKYVKNIFSDMESMSLTNMTSGIYSYKFSKNLSEEISYFSRKYEDVAAIFNSSPDYFKSVKTYFYNLLPYYQDRGNEATSIIASVHHYLGDIHLAEENYNLAVNQYRAASELQREMLYKSQDDQRPMLIVRYAHSMLKLGLAYEKRNNCDYAFLIYNTLTDELVKFRDIDPADLGMKSSLIFDCQKDGTRLRNNYILHDRAIPDDCCNYIPDIISESTTNDYTRWSYGSQLLDNLSSYLSPGNKSIISKLAVFEDLRIVYLSILAKLFSLEKYNVCGISASNIKLAESEFEFIYKMTNISEKYLLEVDFYRKLGDILYYKNKNFFSNNRWSDIFGTWSIDLKKIIEDFMLSNKIKKKEFEKIIAMVDSVPYAKDAESFVSCWSDLQEEIKSELKKAEVDEEDGYPHLASALLKSGKPDIDTMLESMFACYSKNRIEIPSHKNIPLPCPACCFYNRSMTVFMKNGMGPDTANEKRYSNVLYFLEKISDNTKQTFHYNELLHAALALSSLGDVMLSCSFFEHTLDFKLLGDCLDKINGGEVFKAEDWAGTKLCNITRSILYNVAAMRCFERLGKYKDACESLVRIIKITTHYCNKVHGVSCDQDLSERMAFIDKLEGCITRVVKMLYSARGFSSMPEIQRLKHIADEDGYRHILMGLSSVMPDIEDLVFSYYELLISVTEPSVGLISYLYQAPALKSMGYVSMTYNRLMALHFKERLNRIVYDRCFEIEDKKLRTKDEHFLRLLIDSLGCKCDEKSMTVFLVRDSIFCLKTILSSLDTVPNRTIFSDTYIRDVYNSISGWVDLSESLRDLGIDCGDDIKNDYQLKATFTKENAERYYHKAIWKHIEGRDYHQMIENYYILDDDLQNDTAHFYLAYERYKLRCENGTNNVIINLKEINKKRKGHSYYKASSYLGHHIEILKNCGQKSERTAGKGTSTVEEREFRVGDRIRFSDINDMYSILNKGSFYIRAPHWNDGKCSFVLGLNQESEKNVSVDDKKESLFKSLGGNNPKLKDAIFKFDASGYVVEVILSGASQGTTS